ncbi:hypothetical protein BN6_18380 [Saccharothrix espanaensis DSM 44229]|uniref:Uncharacterized protein n=1 Tax=Saccharothrix espanaensis (strain ATCC 51144 / DSM 44229 / JCM 9112 / NBRC 15066 / NRRL 15764) TaxID=1179773 RepID=K0JY90_SACES|nr:hypothetical protein BN6_18380 [Saccharothrix espanaensis DSM 44229]
MTPEKPLGEMDVAELLANQVDQEPAERAQPVADNSSDTE